MSSEHRVHSIDYLCNAFTPDRRVAWERAIAASGIPLKIVRDPADGFAEPHEMVSRMDGLNISTLLLPAADLTEIARGDSTEYENVAIRWKEVEDLVADHPGRFAALAVVDPTRGMAGVEGMRRLLANSWVVGLYLHTHSWDRRFDHADLYPYYALCSELDVPFVMQAGTSGGLMPSECGVPLGVDRPALYFPRTRFLLSHTGWPWVDDAVAMALKHPNVFLGTAAYPPRHWHPSVTSFIRGPGAEKTVFGTNFPTVGHHRAIEQLEELDLPEQLWDALVSRNAARVFTRLSEL